MNMKSAAERGRDELIEWERAQPDNYFLTDGHLQNILKFYWGDEIYALHAERLENFGGLAATVVDRAVRRSNVPENLPRLDRYTAAGERTEGLHHSEDHHIAGRHIYGSGAMSVYAAPGSNLLALALFYLSSYNGESGHNCPLACTAGVIKTLQFAGSEPLKAKYLPRLLDPNYDELYHGAQFLTEVQGGSDVGANSMRAVPLDAAAGTWLINGEKWFCSNVTADLALITARPEGAGDGTRGLGLFLVPRRLDDGSPNGLHIRRLKDKLGTKSLATAEVDFRDAVACLVGEPGRGFLQAMEYVINTSRLYNAVGSAAAARRAYVVASTYARHRRAFGRAIAEFPLVAETLAEMHSVAAALTSGSLCLAHLRDEIEAGRADETGRAFFRLAVNLNKYRTSISGTDVIRRGIEVLGGNGAMENFSVLPRLLRDSVIFEAWEGAHNTLLAQSVRDLQRHRLHEPFCERLAEWFGALEDQDGPGRRGMAEAASLRSDLDELIALDEGIAGLRMRSLADRMMWLFYIACLARELEYESKRGIRTSKRQIIDLLRERFIETDGKQDLSGYSKRISDISDSI
ncbi:MAG: acyl-CoA dehydrogenase family protein [Acidobacteriota bacterium]|nr:MAG: acyl-CoA dehydrogenase family protein [Acidobacteriota bacterium]